MGSRSLKPIASISRSLCALFAGTVAALADLPNPPPQASLTIHPGGGNPVAETAANPHLLPDSITFHSPLNQHGIDYTVGYAVEVLGNTSGGWDRGAVAEGLLKLQLDLDTDGMGLWTGGQFHASALYSHGDSLTQRFTGDLFTFSNIDAPDAFRLFEFWYEHALVPDRLSVRIGQLAADEEFAGTEHGCLFINGTCGWPAFLALNVPSPAYPVGTLGARLQLSLDHGWIFRAAIYNGDPYPIGDDGHPENGHGTHFSWQDSLSVFEVQNLWNDGEAATGLPGGAKIGGWYHSGLFEHPRYDSQGLSLADPGSNGEPELNRGHWGGYLAVDQQIWRESAESPDQGLGLFSRLGIAPSDRSVLEYYLEGGLTYTGLLPGRDADGIGVAVVYGRMSRDSRALVADANAFTGGDDPLPDFEMVVESTYSIQISPAMTIQPVVSYLIHPGGFPGYDALVLGLRATMDF